MAKKKRLLPSLREKKRYLAFEIISQNPIKDYLSVYNAIHESSLDLLGKLGIAKSGILMLKEKWMPEQQKGVIRVNHKYVDHLRASVTLVDNIDEEDVIVRSIGVSGILKKLTGKYLAG